MPPIVYIIGSVICLFALIYLVNVVLYKNLYYKFIEEQGNDAWFNSTQRAEMNKFLGAILWKLKGK